MNLRDSKLGVCVLAREDVCDNSKIWKQKIEASLPQGFFRWIYSTASDGILNEGLCWTRQWVTCYIVNDVYRGLPI